MYKDPFQRLKPSIKPIYNQNNGGKFSKKIASAQKKEEKSKRSKKSSPRHSLQGEGPKVRKKSKSPKQNKHVNSGQFPLTDAMSDEIRIEDADDNYTIH